MSYSWGTTIRIHIHAETQSTIMTNELTSLEKYTTHTLFKRVAKGLCVGGELETEQTATYWPQIPLTIAALLSHSAGLLNRGSWGPKPSVWTWFSLPRTATRTSTAWLQLTRNLCGTGFYNYLTSTYFPWASHSTRPRSRLYLDIFDRMHLFLDWRLGRRSICYININLFIGLRIYLQLMYKLLSILKKSCILRMTL